MTRAFTQYSNSDVLYRIPIDVPYGQVIDFSVPQLYEGITSMPGGFNNARVSLVDDLKNPVDFQGVNWHAGIMFKWYDDESGGLPEAATSMGPPTKKMRK